MVKTIGYGGDSKKEDEVKRDENGVEVMDIESEDEEGGDKADAPEESAKGDGSALVVATKAISQMLPIASTTSTSPKESTSNDSRLGSKPPSDRHPATPLTQDEKIKEKVKDSVSTKHPNKSPSAPPSPSGTSTPSKGPSKDRNRSGSTPTTPKRNQSPAPSKKSIPPSPPNYVLPTWEDIFHVPPRSVPPPPPTSPAVPPSLPQTASSSPDEGTKTILGKTMKFVSGVLFAKDPPQNHANGSGPSTLSPSKVQRSSGSRPRTSRLGSAINSDGGGSTLDIHALLQQERVKRFERYGEELPKAWSIVDPPPVTPPTPSLRRSLSFEGFLPGSSSVRQVDDVLRGCKRVVIIGVHGWFPGAVMRTMLGEPTGTSSKFANMMEQALHDFEDAHGVQLEKITKIPLEGEGTISRRVEKLYGSLLVNNEWVKDLHEADAVIVATHSQGSVVSTHLLDRLISDHHIRTQVDQVDLAGGDTFPSSVGMTVSPTRKPQRVCCLALCGIHLGPLRYLSSSSLLQPYIQYFESTAARELFEFQSTESAVSKAYVKALRNVLHHGVKMVYVASLNDQVVPIYSGIFTAASHPLILRALYIDGDAYHSSDFLSNLLVLLLRIRNSGIPDGGLLAHLSEATAGSLSGIGHSTAYEEPSTFALAVRYLFEANEGVAPYADLQLDSFDAAHEQNDYEIPWSLRDVIADERVIHFFSKEVSQLRDAFNDWQPKTTILRDLKRKLQPIQRLPSSFSSLHSTSKL
ncbi:hypothetical protein BKA70DRAFT_387392 [Coprinopsis sp. MPI-PUGE-AT-0042]|nr:hypothetical protein BKA70DRAFT_387392 [Coprinopsis sp. MPI-PUGE-AT-0042]